MHEENDSRVALAFDLGNEALARCFEQTLLENRLKRREHEKEPKDIAWRHRHLSLQIFMTMRLRQCEICHRCITSIFLQKIGATFGFVPSLFSFYGFLCLDGTAGGTCLTRGTGIEGGGTS